jgi:hypothetical protein
LLVPYPSEEIQVWEISPRANSPYVIPEIVVRYRMDTHGLSRASVIFVVHDTIANQSVLSKFNLPLHARTIDPESQVSLSSLISRGSPINIASIRIMSFAFEKTVS